MNCLTHITNAGRSVTTQESATQESAAPEAAENRRELVAGLPAEELEVRLLRAHRETEVGHRLLAFYLHEMQNRGLHQWLGFRSAVHYAVERLDMCRRKAQLLVAVGSALLKLRAVDRAFAEGVIGWSKVVLLCRIAIEGTEAEWLEKAKELSCRELDWLVRSSFPGDRPPAGRDGGGLPRVRFHVHAELGALDYEVWEQAKQKLGEERGAPATDAELMAELSRMLLTTRADGSIPGRKPVEDSCFRVVVDATGRRVETQDGPVPLSDAEVEVAVSDDAARLTQAKRSRVLDRDGHRCRCCRSGRNLQVHHIRFVSRGGETRMDNLMVLCSYCHSRVHVGLLKVRRAPDGEVEFVDRKGRALRGALPQRLRLAVDYAMPRERGVSPKGPTERQEAEDRELVLQNLDRLKWRGGRMVLV